MRLAKQVERQDFAKFACGLINPIIVVQSSGLEANFSVFGLTPKFSKMAHMSLCQLPNT
jgi:hypothetical protein